MDGGGLAQPLELDKTPHIGTCEGSTTKNSQYFTLYTNRELNDKD